MLGSLFKSAVNKAHKLLAGEFAEKMQNTESENRFIDVPLTALTRSVLHVSVVNEPTTATMETYYRWMHVSALLKEYRNAAPQDSAIDGVIASIDNIGNGIALFHNKHSASLGRNDLHNIYHNRFVLSEASENFRARKLDLGNVVSLNLKGIGPVRPFNPYAAKGDTIAVFMKGYTAMMEKDVMPHIVPGWQPPGTTFKASFPGRKYNR